ncbi:endonuclease [Mycoplasma sp. 1232]|uniref:endonuclease n=1 Tax=Mycoplasma sp. 1232 TaxID=3108527 RepID=UPI002B25DC49|nr:endonuclease [Mycoplasma sp. 1232]MEA4333724.1 endonuclease [Mycoplasma sp. 1232]
MKKIFKKLFLTSSLAASAILPMVSLSCNKTSDNGRKEIVTPKPVIPAAPAEVSLENASNVFKPIEIPATLKDQILTYLKDGNNKFLYFMRNTNEIGLNRKTGPAVGALFEEAINAKFHPANFEEPIFTYKDTDRPNGDINFQFNASTNELTLTYKAAINTGSADNSGYEFSTKTFTSKFTVFFKEAQTTTTPPTTGGNTGSSNITITPVNSNYSYNYDSSNNYYASANGKSGAELYAALLKIQKAHLSGVRGYGDIPGFYQSSNSPFRDIYFEKDNTMLDIYSENPTGTDPYTYRSYPTSNKASGESDGMNREHVIPQSWFSKLSPMVSDIHHIYPTDIKVNGVRSNYPHDLVANASASWTSMNGGKLGTNSIGMTSFEPINEFKGDIARSYLYFTVTYNDRNLAATSQSIFTRTVPYIKEHYFNTFANWTATDPVSPFDVARNNKIAAFEGGLRNPFIDYPNLLENLVGSNPKPFTNLGVLVSATPKN